jgi:hypothetical protein
MEKNDPVSVTPRLSWARGWRLRSPIYRQPSMIYLPNFTPEDAERFRDLWARNREMPRIMVVPADREPVLIGESYPLWFKLWCGVMLIWVLVMATLAVTGW